MVLSKLVQNHAPVLFCLTTTMNISLAAEHIAGTSLTNAVITGVAGSLLILVLFLSFAHSPKVLPTKKQNFIEWIIELLLNLATSITGDRQKALKFLPLVATFFIFIIINNWLGLIPGVGSIGFHEMHNNKDVFVPLFRSTNADLNTTLALALVTVGATQYFGISQLHLSYFKKFINFSSPVAFFMGILEIISEVAKVISFSFRLFGNVFAGEVLLAVITGLVPFIVPAPFYGLELFVGFIQALVFSMLSLVFFHVATQQHHA